MPHYISIPTGEKDKAGNAIVEWFLADRDGKLIEATKNISMQENPKELARRAEIEGFKHLLRTGQDLYKIDPETGRRYHIGPIETIAGTMDAAKAEFAKEQEIETRVRAQVLEEMKAESKSDEPALKKTSKK